MSESGTALHKASRMIQIPPIDPLSAQATVLYENVRKQPHVVVSKRTSHDSLAAAQLRQRDT